MTKVVIVGSRYELPILRPLERIFVRNGWVVCERFSIEDARKTQHDLLIVLAHNESYTLQFEEWAGYHPTVWLCRDKWDLVPRGAQRVMGPIRPSMLFKICKMVLKEPPAFFRGDSVLLVFPVEAEKNLDAAVINCGVLEGDSGQKGNVQRADTYVLQSREDLSARGIKNGDILSGIKLYQMVHL